MGSSPGLKSRRSQREWPLVSSAVPPLPSVKSCSALCSPSSFFGINTMGVFRLCRSFLAFGHFFFFFFLPFSSQTGFLAFIP